MEREGSQRKLQRKRLMEKYNLFLDDDPNRIPGQLPWIELPLVEWTFVRSYKQFVDTIKQKGVPVIVSFDHDLADEHYQEYFRVHETKGVEKIRYDKLEEKTGYHCAKWLANHCVNNNIPIPLYYLHTRNGYGAKNIASILESARKVIEENKIKPTKPLIILP